MRHERASSRTAGVSAMDAASESTKVPATLVIRTPSAPDRADDSPRRVDVILERFLAWFVTTNSPCAPSTTVRGRSRHGFAPWLPCALRRSHFPACQPERVRPPPASRAALLHDRRLLAVAVVAAVEVVVAPTQVDTVDHDAQQLGGVVPQLVAGTAHQLTR